MQSAYCRQLVCGSWWTDTCEFKRIAWGSTRPFGIFRMHNSNKKQEALRSVRSLFWSPLRAIKLCPQRPILQSQ